MEGRRKLGAGRPRKACSTCKAQKIRCTEERPSCKRCVRLHHICIYSDGRLPERSDRPAQQPAVPKDVPYRTAQSPPKGHIAQVSVSRAQGRPILTQSSSTRGSKQYIGLLEHLLPELVEIYFNYVYNAHLLLHKRSFLESIADGTACTHVVLSVCAWGAKFYEDAGGHPVLKDQGFMLEWAQSAATMVFQEIEDLTRGNIVTYMNLALLFHSQGEWTRAYLYKGHAFLLLDLLGLGPKSLLTENSLQSEIRRRNFWACYVMHCATSEKGAQFKLEDHASTLPLPWPDEDFDAGLAEHPQVSLDSEESDGSVSAELIKATTICPGDGWSATRQLSAQIAFEHAEEMSSLITAILETTPRTSGIPMFTGYSAYCGCAILIPFMWSTNPTFRERVRANIRANTKLLQLMTPNWKFASILNAYVHYLCTLHSKQEIILEDEPKRIDRDKLICFNEDASNTYSSIFEYIAMLRTEGGGYGGSENSENKILGDILSNMADSRKTTSKFTQGTIDGQDNFPDPAISSGIPEHTINHRVTEGDTMLGLLYPFGADAFNFTLDNEMMDIPLFDIT